MYRLLFKTIGLLALVLSFTAVSVAGGGEETPKPDKILAEKIGNFRASGPATSSSLADSNRANDGLMSAAERRYVSPQGNTFIVSALETKTDSQAFSFLTRSRLSQQKIALGDVGTANVVTDHGITFFKGPACITILLSASESNTAKAEMKDFARSLAQQLDGGENDIPVLVKHLPDWEKAYAESSYAVNLAQMKAWFPNQQILDAISFEGDAEAVRAQYDSGLLVIVEFNTATIAKDNDWNIKNKISELRSQPGAAVPSAYRRVGNYSVFVFDAPSEQVANELIDQVKYQQVVQWLGDDPYAYQRATREFTETTLGVFVSVVKASGLALIACLGVGSILGALLFTRRRAQQKNVEAYSDAGGMLRLNLDEMTPETDPARLLGPDIR